MCFCLPALNSVQMPSWLNHYSSLNKSAQAVFSFVFLFPQEEKMWMFPMIGNINVAEGDDEC